jgi:hypothetical protein
MNQVVSNKFSRFKSILGLNNSKEQIKPQNLPEKIIWYYMIGIYVLYFAGAQHLLAPAIGWFFGIYVCKKVWEQKEDTPPAERITIPIGVWIWIICMLFMQVSLIGGHIYFDMGLDRIVRSTINFFIRTWALFALFPLAGCLNIRPKLIYRATCIVCIQSLIFIIIAQLAILVKLDGDLYISPLRSIGGVGSEYYSVFLYGIDGGTGDARLYLFTPWAPALGLVGDLYFFITSQESNKKLRWLGMIGSAAMVWGSDSRLGILCLLTLPFLNLFLANFTRPLVQVGAGVVSIFSGIFGAQILTWVRDFRAQFDGQRAASSRVRQALGDIALYRWWNDSPIWGHGIIEPKGPKVVADKPIGSHHTWFGILFSNGIIGFLALAIPLAWTFIELFIKAQNSKVAQLGLGIILVIFFYTFAENMEALIYVYWPALILLGIALKEKFSPKMLFSAA